MVEMAIVLLAGGEATRFPDKLEQRVDGKPMLERAYAGVRATGWPVYVATKGSFSRALDAKLEAPLLIDRKPRRGPLQAFLGACAMIRAQRIFAVAADQPRMDERVLHRLAAAWEDGDEAVVPSDDAGIEPLAALYDRAAALHYGFELRHRTTAGMRDLIARLATRFVRFKTEHFLNVNRPEDLSDS